VQLVLTSGFDVLQAYKAAFAFAFEQLWKLQFDLINANFDKLHHITIF